MKKQSIFMRLNYNNLWLDAIEKLKDICKPVKKMIVIKQEGSVDPEGHLRLDLLTHLPPGTVEFVVILDDRHQNLNSRKYDFSDLIGKLEWQGDPVKEQRRIRDEE